MLLPAIISSVSLGYTDYGTCETKFLHAYGIETIINPQTGEGFAAQIAVQGNMTSNDVIYTTNSYPPYQAYDYFEFDGIITLPDGGSGTIKIDVGYNYAGISYSTVYGGGTLTIQQYNSTTVQITVQGNPAGQWNVIVDSNQFTAPSSQEAFIVGLWADSGTNSTSSDITTMESC